MAFVTVEVKKWGNSLGIVLPRKATSNMGLKPGEKIEVDIVKHQVVDGFGVCARAKPFKEEKESHQKFW